MHIVHVIHVFMLEGLHKNGTEIAFEKETFATMLSIEVSHACAWKKCLCPRVSDHSMITPSFIASQILSPLATFSDQKVQC